jgi:hypothetical protein
MTTDELTSLAATARKLAADDATYDTVEQQEADEKFWTALRSLATEEEIEEIESDCLCDNCTTAECIDTGMRVLNRGLLGSANKALKEVCNRLSDLGATWEYPGYLSVKRNEHAYFNIGTTNGCFGFDYLYTHEFDPRDTGVLLPLNANADALEKEIRNLVSGYRFPLFA